MGKSMKNMVLLAGVQTAIDTFPTLTGTSAMLCRAITLKPISAEFVERSLIRGYKGNMGQLAVAVHREIEFEVEVAGSGTAGTAPAWGPLIKGCGFSQTLSAGISCIYAPVSSGEPYVYLKGFLDGVLFEIKNAKGSVSFDFSAKGIPVMKYKFVGEYSAVTDTANPGSLDFTAFKQPLTIGRVNTPSYTFFGVTACMSALTIDTANALVWRDLVNCGGATSADRKPAGSTTIEFTSVATKNWADLVKTGTTGALQLVHGATPGNIVQVDAPAVQLNSEPSFSDDNTVAMIQLGFSLQPVTGNDELLITLT